jgi:signal transduction histidine kinase
MSAASPPSDHLHVRLTELWAEAFRRLDLLPREEPLGPVEYSPGLVAYVACICLVAVAAAVLTVRAPSDPLTLVLGALTVGAVAAYGVHTLTGAEARFSADVMVHLGLTLVTGPVGALAGSLTASIGARQRFRPGWFRTLFNAADYFLANLAAWFAFQGILRLGSGVWWVQLLAGLGAGIAQYLANHLPLAGVIRLASRGQLRFWRVFTRSLSTSPYFLGYGLSAEGFVLLHHAAGAFGFFLMLIPPILLQGFLIFLARRVHAFEVETKAYQEARVRLLQRAIDASNEERERIAAAIHDGIVQDLAGLTFSLGAYSNSDENSLSGEERARLLQLVSEGAETARRATRDLRSLIIEIAPPKLKELGLKPALEDLLANLGSGISTRLEVEEGLALGDSTNGLLYRVAQEAVRNSMKYSSAEHLTIEIRGNDADVVLRIVDDGRGFDPAEQAYRLEKGHLGLGLLQRTVADGGGSLRINSAPGRGTLVEIRVPIGSGRNGQPQRRTARPRSHR